MLTEAISKQSNALVRKDGETNAGFPLNSSEPNAKGNSIHQSPASKLARIAKLAGNKKVNSKHRWGSLVEAARAAKVSRIWGGNRSKSEDSVTSDGSYGVHPITQEDIVPQYERLSKLKLEACTSSTSAEPKFTEEYEGMEGYLGMPRSLTESHHHSPEGSNARQLITSSSISCEDGYRSRKFSDYSVSMEAPEKV